MARPRKWASDAERKAAKRINGRPSEINGQTESVAEHADGINGHEPNKRTRPDAEPPGFVRFVHQPHVPLSLFASHGRGTVRRHTDGRDYVMVSRHAGSDLGELGVVAADDWIARLSQSCIHGNRGWSCHTC